MVGWPQCSSQKHTNVPLPNLKKQMSAALPKAAAQGRNLLSSTCDVSTGCHDVRTLFCLVSCVPSVTKVMKFRGDFWFHPSAVTRWECVAFSLHASHCACFVT